MTDSKKLQKILNFSKFLNEVREIERTIYTATNKRQESDSEHSFQLAMICWYIIEVNRLDLNLNLVLKYALVHDLVEVYAGDYYFGEHKDGGGLTDKYQREKRAVSKIRQKLPEFKEMVKYIEDYEALSTEEARFVYSMDVVEPMFNIYNDKGQLWKRDGITKKILIDRRGQKATTSKDVKNLFKQILKASEKYLPKD